MANIDWARLVAQGRAKAIGIPWTEEELVAIYKLKIPADYVRKGILTLEDYKEAIAEGSVAPSKTKDELMKEAKKLKIAVTPDATVESLEVAIENAKNAKKNKEAKKTADAKPEKAKKETAKAKPNKK